MMSNKEVKLSDCPIVSDIVDKIDVLEKDIDVNYRRIYYDNDDEKVTAILNSLISSLQHHKNLLNILRSSADEPESIYGF